MMMVSISFIDEFYCFRNVLYNNDVSCWNVRIAAIFVTNLIDFNARLKNQASILPRTTNKYIIHQRPYDVVAVLGGWSSEEIT